MIKKNDKIIKKDGDYRDPNCIGRIVAVSEKYGEAIARYNKYWILIKLSGEGREWFKIDALRLF